MSKLPNITSRELVRALSKQGFFKSRQKGSHLIMKHADGRRTVIPIHKSRDIAPGTLKGILRDIEITTDALIRALKK